MTTPTNKQEQMQATAPHPHKALIQAYLNGETIQIHLTNGWEDLEPLDNRLGMPGFTTSQTYRKKPVKKEGWVNIYKGIQSKYTDGINASKAEADGNACANRIDCVKIEWEE